MTNNNNTTNRQFFQEKHKFLFLAVAVPITVALVLSTFMLSINSLCTFAGYGAGAIRYDSEKSQLETIIHYATSQVVPQLTNGEIRLVFEVLQSPSPCNFLVFGLGHDSRMWHSLNPGGTTLFIENDPNWVQTVLGNAPFLQVRNVQYRTKVLDADKLLASYRSEPDCMPSKELFLRGNERCKLALNALPADVYDKEWDLILIDAPKGYFDEAPGRMAPIYSAAVMARNRKGSGVTHVFLHNIDRREEKAYAEEFLCRKNFVKSAGKLGHYEIPSAVNATSVTAFC